MARNKIINKRYRYNIRIFKETTNLPNITIAKNKKEGLRKIRPYHTNNKAKVFSPLILTLKKFFDYIKKKIK